MEKERVISLRIKAEDAKKLDEIADKQGVKRSVILKKAITNFINNATQSQSGSVQDTRIFDVEKRVGALLTRINILTTQMDKVLTRLKVLEEKK